MKTPLVNEKEFLAESGHTNQTYLFPDLPTTPEGLRPGTIYVDGDGVIRMVPTE